MGGERMGRESRLIRSIAAMRLLREKLCVYGGGRCDCKFGFAGKLGTASEIGNGCPELLTVVEAAERTVGHVCQPAPDAIARQFRLDETSRFFAHAILANPEARQADSERIMREAWRLAEAWEAERARRIAGEK